MSSNAIAKKVRYALRWLPDSVYIQLNYFAHFHKFANLKHPQTFNEKLNWLKLNDHNPLYIKLVDKFEVKRILSDIVGERYIIPTIGVWNSFDEIDFDLLPNQFVLKCTHDSEGVVIVKDKSSLDMAAAREKLVKALNQNFYYIGREWPYKNVEPRIIAEQYMEDQKDGELKDYKFFCFAGEPKVMFVASGRGGKMTSDFFDMDFNHLDIVRKYPNSLSQIEKPLKFEEMKTLAKTLSKGFPHIRVDFYEVNGRVYIGELTLYTSSGFVPFKPAKWDEIFGSWLQLDNNTCQNDIG